ncbi:MAG: hypothetical protein ACE5FT_03395 [Candidatus Nanoarchaeia archaeon]
MNNLTFITNERDQKLSSRFATLVNDTKNFDCLVGYFYASGFYDLYKSLEKTDKIRILIGISTNKGTYDLIRESKEQQTLHQSHKEAKDEGYIFKMVKTCRKFNMGMLLITQDVDDLLANKAGKALLNNSEYTLLLRQKPAIIDQVVNTFKLSQAEKEHLITASNGEGVLIMANDHSEIKIIASPEEHKIITTNPDELLKRELGRTHAIVTEYESTFEPICGLYKASELN